VRYNLVHPRTDPDYMRELSADAVPALLAGWEHVPAAARPQTAYWLMATLSPKDPPDWRSWNWGRERGRAAVAAHEAELATLAKAYTDQFKPQR